MSQSDLHQPVLLNEALDGLAIKAEGIYIDATFGRGGHSGEILKKLTSGRLIALDRDLAAVDFAKQHKDFQVENFKIFQANFIELEEIAKSEAILGKVDGILLDLGVSSPQLDMAERGFSFMQDGPLDMRMNQAQSLTAKDWINSASIAEIQQVLKDFGEERYALRIAKAIVNAREKAPITHTLQLATIVSQANPRWEQQKHPATRSFQAIRIFINQEFFALEKALQAAIKVLKTGGRLAVISFHSLEDHMVKNFFNTKSQVQAELRHLPLQQAHWSFDLKKIGKAVKASAAELKQNPRARSATLRVAEKIA